MNGLEVDLERHVWPKSSVVKPVKYSLLLLMSWTIAFSRVMLKIQAGGGEQELEFTLVQDQRDCNLVSRN